MLRLPYVAELTESTSSFVNVGLDAFMGTFVTINKAFDLSEIVDAVQFLSTVGDSGCLGAST